MKYLLEALVEDGLLLYNIVTSEIALLSDNEKKLYKSSPVFYNAILDELIAHHYLVPEDFDESKSVQELRAIVKKLTSTNRINGFTILPTTECNARCFYCFESDYKHCTMTPKIASDVVTYISSKCQGKPIELSWFGGEPLLGNKRISQICTDLKQRDIKFSSSMVSNAFLFDKDLVQVAKSEWNLTVVQITLDGTEKVYNETKAYIYPKENPYRRVLNNIEMLLDKEIAVSIRLNVTDTNAEDLSKLIDELSERFGGKKRFSCYSHAVYDKVGYKPLVYNEQTREMIDEKTVALDAKLNEKGLLGSITRLPKFRVLQCMADNNSSRLIYPDGTIGKCENRSSLESIGDIYNDISDEEMNEKYKKVIQFPGCSDCCLYPSCINLAACPETGRCTRTKLEWKIHRFTQLLINEYRNSQKNSHETCVNSHEICAN